MLLTEVRWPKSTLRPSFHHLKRAQLPHVLRNNKSANRRSTTLNLAQRVPTEALTLDLTDFISKGPLLERCGIDKQLVKDNVAYWAKLGEQLACNLKFDHATLDPVQKLRIYHYYLPVYFWCVAQLEKHRQSGSQEALIIGISAPQGCGKTTLVEQLENLLGSNGYVAATASIDDFYLKFQDQRALAERFPSNPLLQYRGNAGTHDLELGVETLKKLRSLRSPSESAQVPRYDKSANGGRGDRAAPEAWPTVVGPVDIVLFEGWMSGFRPLPQDQVAAVDPALVEVNAFLENYGAVWDAVVNSWLVIRIGDPQWVFKWRLQAEEAMRASGKTGMSDEQIQDFVDRFIPAYKAYLPALYSQGPTSAQPDKTLVIEVDEGRSPVAQQPPPVV